MISCNNEKKPLLSLDNSGSINENNNLYVEQKNYAVNARRKPTSGSFW